MFCILATQLHKRYISAKCTIFIKSKTQCCIKKQIEPHTHVDRLVIFWLRNLLRCHAESFEVQDEDWWTLLDCACQVGRPFFLAVDTVSTHAVTLAVQPDAGGECLRFVKLTLHPAYRFVFLTVCTLRVAVLFQKVDVPLTRDVGVAQQQRPDILAVINPRLNWAPMTSLAPATDRTRNSRHIHMFKYKRRQWLSFDKLLRKLL